MVYPANGRSHHPTKVFNPSYVLFKLGLLFYTIGSSMRISFRVYPKIMVLGKEVNIKEIDYEFYCLKVSLGCCALSLMLSRLSWVELNCPFFRDNDIAFVLNEPSVTDERFGEVVDVEPKACGANLPMTEVNKEEYTELVAHRIAGHMKEQFRAFVKGLGDVLLLDLLHVFDEHGLELLIGGVTEIDMDDWTYFTDYRRYEKAGRVTRVVEQFWACLRSPMERGVTVRFTTGTSRVPVNGVGFKGLQGGDSPRWFMIAKSGDPWIEEPHLHQPP